MHNPKVDIAPFIPDIHALDIMGIKRTGETSYEVSLNLEGSNAWKWVVDREARRRETVGELSIKVQYIRPKELRRYDGFYGWIGTTESYEIPRNDLGCLAPKEGPYGIVWGRKNCEGGTWTQLLPGGVSGEVMSFLDSQKGWMLKNASMNRDGDIWASYVYDTCPHVGKCTVQTRVYYPVARIPRPSQPEDEATTTFARTLVSLVAGVVGKLHDPGFPDRYGVYTSRGYHTKWPIQEERFQQCRSCFCYKYVKRGNDEDSEMREGALGDINTHGIEPVEWCYFKRDWIASFAKARSFLHSKGISPGSSLGQYVMKQASEQGACEAYMWRTKVYSNSKDNYNQQVVWHPWTSGARSVVFEDGEHPRIVGYGPEVSISLNLSTFNKKVVELQRAFNR
jgi:hypothetical protein